MCSDIITLGLSVLGIIFLLIIFVLKIMVWQSDKITVVVPFYTDNAAIYSTVYQLYSDFNFLGLHKKCTIVLINYGASENFCNEVREFYKNYNFVKILNSCDLQNKLF